MVEFHFKNFGFGIGGKQERKTMFQRLAFAFLVIFNGLFIYFEVL